MEISLLDTYFNLINKLSLEARLELISRLSESIRQERDDREASLLSTFGQLNTEESADEIIQSLRTARTFRDKDFDLK